MKTRLRLLFAPLVFGLLVWQLGGCKHTPSPPTVADAIAVWKNTHANPHLADLITLTKTNGQMATVNGVHVYTFIYEAKEKIVIPQGNVPAGAVNTYQSNYPFQWTEKGWMGPDGKVYPEH
jgi:hypothetical protein